MRAGSTLKVFARESDNRNFQISRRVITIMPSWSGCKYIYFLEPHNTPAACHARLLRRSSAFRGASALPGLCARVQYENGEPTCVLSAEPHLTIL